MTTKSNGQKEKLCQRAPFKTIWLISGEEIVGEAVIRLGYLPFIENFAGHITYYVLPTSRGLGLGKKLLASAIDMGLEANLDPVIICCSQENYSSRGVIQSLGLRVSEIIDNRDRWSEMTEKYQITSTQDVQ